MKLIPFLQQPKIDKNIPLVTWIWRSYFRTSLIPILSVEVGLILVYLLSNSITNKENIGALRALAENEASQLSILETKGISQQLKNIAQSTALMQSQTASIMSNLQGTIQDDPDRYAYSKDGVFYTTKDNGGSALFYSGIIPVGETERQKALQSAALDPIYRDIQKSNPLIVQVYYNTFDSMNRIYPYMDVITQYSPKMDIPSFNFYYEADAKHNPLRKVVWTDVYKDPAGQGWMVSAIAPVYSAQKLEGVVGLDITVSAIVKEVLDLDIPWNGYAILVSKYGNIIAIPKQGEQDWGKDEVTTEKYTGEINKDTLKSPELNIYQNKNLPKELENIRTQDHGILNTELSGKRIVSWALIPETEWKLIITLPEDQIFKSVIRLSDRLNRFAVYMVLGLLAFYIVFFIVLYRQSRKMSQSISEPLQHIDEMVNVVATGNTLIEAPEFPVAELNRTAQGVKTMGIILDNSSRLRQLAELELLERSKQLQSVFDLSPDSLILTDSTSKIVLVNPALCHMTGLQAEDWLVKEEAFIWETLEKLSSDTVANLPPAAASFKLELERPRKRVLQCQILKINNGASTEFKLIYLRDVTRDEEVKQMKNQFITTAAHELRTPLTTILGYTNLFKKEMVTEDMRASAYDSIIEKTTLLINIVNEMLDLARIDERHDMDFQMQAYDAETLVHEALASLPIPESRNPVVLNTAPNLTVNVDKQRFKEALGHLIDNAYKYSKEGNVSLKITHDPEKNAVGFHVKDSGLGMTEDQQVRVFERFWRADDSGKIPGTGLGLSYVEEIVKLLSGRIELNSAPGQGSTFTIWLPIR